MSKCIPPQIVREAAVDKHGRTVSVNVLIARSATPFWLLRYWVQPKFRRPNGANRGGNSPDRCLSLAERIYPVALARPRELLGCNFSAFDTDTSGGCAQPPPHRVGGYGAVGNEFVADLETIVSRAQTAKHVCKQNLQFECSKIYEHVINNREDYDDDNAEKAGLSVSGVENMKSWFTSSKSLSEQLQTWLSKMESADDVFSHMKLRKAENLLFNHHQFSLWLKCVDDLSAKTLTKGTSAISTLTAQYGDDGLYKMVEEDMETPKTKNLAAKLQAGQMQH
ncbi:hypothetical protein ON010_g18255 [Phytophthora cinnamomi]|nr:hypothetical protein ON010_g18255 [Phytophthora cinnamomi]